MLPMSQTDFFFVWLILFRRIQFGPIKKQLPCSGAEPGLFIKPRLKMLWECTDKSAGGWEVGSQLFLITIAICCGIFNKTNRPPELCQILSMLRRSVLIYLASFLRWCRSHRRTLALSTSVCVSTSKKDSAHTHTHTGKCTPVVGWPSLGLSSDRAH